MDVPGTSQLALTAHLLEMVQDWLRSVSNEGHFTCRTKQLFICISASIWHTPLKQDILHISRLRYKWN